VFGGTDGKRFFNDMYVFDTVSWHWSKLNTTGTIPEPRAFHSAFPGWDEDILIFGGKNESGALPPTTHALKLGS
jgi:N-acetylneuraminic acid mutarotase